MNGKEMVSKNRISDSFEIGGIKGYGNSDFPFNLDSALFEMLDNREIKKDINGNQYETYPKFDEFGNKICSLLKEKFQDKQKHSGNVLIQMGDPVQSGDTAYLDFAILSNKSDHEFIEFKARTNCSQQLTQKSHFEIKFSLSKENASLFADVLASTEFGLVFDNLEKVNGFIQQYGTRNKNMPTLELVADKNGDLELKVVKDLKYELAMDEATCVMFGKKHYRIRALRDIPAHGIPAGRVGGFVESEKNLSQEGDCWVAHDALVTGDACVTDNAVVSGRATVMEQAKIQKDAQVSGYVVVTGNAVVGEHALVTGNAVVMDEAKVLSTAYICGDAQVCGKSKIGNATVKDRAVVMDSFVWGEAHISGDAVVVNNARLHNAIKLVGHDYAEGNMPVQEQSGAIKKLFHNTRTERKKKPFERNRTAGKKMKPNVRK